MRKCLPSMCKRLTVPQLQQRIPICWCAPGLLQRITLPGVPLGHAILNLCNLVLVARELYDALLRHKY